MYDQSYLIQLAYCITAAFLFLLGSGWIKCEFITKIRRYFSSLQRQINNLHDEIQQHQKELDQIPIMDQFAANRKKQRIINKLNDDLAKLIQTRDKQEMASNLAWNFIGKGLYISLGIYLATKSPDLTVITLNSAHFYPFNRFLVYPNSEFNSKEIHVSLFSFILLTFFAAKIVYRRIFTSRKDKFEAMFTHPELD